VLSYNRNGEKRINFRLKHLSTFRCVLNKDVKKRLVNVLVQPMYTFEYGDVLYFNTGRRNKERLQRAHNSCVRFIAGVLRREHISGFRERLDYVRLDLRRRCGIIRASLNCFLLGSLTICILNLFSF
jgi:hypothetical protein